MFDIGIILKGIFIVVTAGIGYIVKDQQDKHKSLKERVDSLEGEVIILKVEVAKVQGATDQLWKVIDTRFDNLDKKFERFDRQFEVVSDDIKHLISKSG